MKRVIAEYPYNEYYLYVIFHKNEGRQYANLIPINKGNEIKRKTISYARYLVSVNEKRILDKNEHVDHKDDNKGNDDMNNLQILTLKENNIKAAKVKGCKTVVLKCPSCHKIFERRRGQTHMVKGGAFTGCSRKCSTSFSALLHSNPDDEKYKKSLHDNLVKEYVKHK